VFWDNDPANCAKNSRERGDVRAKVNKGLSALGLPALIAFVVNKSNAILHTADRVADPEVLVPLVTVGRIDQ
jgi:hypothetical protein